MMNLLKKLVVLAMILIIASISAYAETAQPLLDNFNSFEADDNRSTTGYPKNADESPVFLYHATYSKNYGSSNIKTGAGPDGSTALIVGGRACDISLMTIELDTTGSVVYEISYDIKFNQQNTMSLGSNSWFNATKALFKLTSDGKIQTTSDGSTYTDAGTYQADTWYKVIIIRTGTKKYGYLVDTQGNAIYSYLANDSSSATAKVSVLQMGSSVAKTTTGTIDNAKIVSYVASENAPSLISCSVEDEEKNVARNKELTFVFDQEITDDSVITFARADGEAITEITEVEIEKTFYNTLVMEYTGLLDRNTEYVVSFENVSNGTLVCNDEITFTTEDLHVWNDVTISSAEVNEDDSALTDITFEIGDEYGYSEFSGSVMAVAYLNGTMVSADIVPLSNVLTGEVTVSFDIGTLTANSKIGIILMDVVNGPIPLAGGMFEN